MRRDAISPATIATAIAVAIAIGITVVIARWVLKRLRRRRVLSTLVKRTVARISQ